MKKYFVFLALVFFFAFSDTETLSSVTYDGEIFDTQHGQSDGDEAGAGFGAKGTATVSYTLPELVAIGIYTAGDITSTQGAPLLSGKFISNSNLSIANDNDVLNDIVKSGNEVDKFSNSQYFRVNGVVYSSSSSGLVTVEPMQQGGTSFVPGNSTSVQFNNQVNSGSIDVAFNGTFTGLSSGAFTGNTLSISNSTNLTFGSDNRATFQLTGDVIENSVSKEDDAGTYEGSLKVTITSF